MNDTHDMIVWNDTELVTAFCLSFGFRDFQLEGYDLSKIYHREPLDFFKMFRTDPTAFALERGPVPFSWVSKLVVGLDLPEFYGPPNEMLNDPGTFAAVPFPLVWDHGRRAWSLLMLAYMMYGRAQAAVMPYTGGLTAAQFRARFGNLVMCPGHKAIYLLPGVQNAFRLGNVGSFENNIPLRIIPPTPPYATAHLNWVLRTQAGPSAAGSPQHVRAGSNASENNPLLSPSRSPHRTVSDFGDFSNQNLQPQNSPLLPDSPDSWPESFHWKEDGTGSVLELRSGLENLGFEDEFPALNELRAKVFCICRITISRQ